MRLLSAARWWGCRKNLPDIPKVTAGGEEKDDGGRMKDEREAAGMPRGVGCWKEAMSPSAAKAEMNNEK
jgi:hypothetical protein